MKWIHQNKPGFYTGPKKSYEKMIKQGYLPYEGEKNYDQLQIINGNIIEKQQEEILAYYIDISEFLFVINGMLTDKLLYDKLQHLLVGVGLLSSELIEAKQINLYHPVFQSWLSGLNLKIDDIIEKIAENRKELEEKNDKDLQQ